MAATPSERLNVAVIGTGISGLSAAWLLNRRHTVTVYEKAFRLGGHTNTMSVLGHGGATPVETGFIVFNLETYPNLTAFFQHLRVATEASDMSFAVSLRDGRLEYAGTDLGSMFAQKSNLLRPTFWSMLRDLAQFYREGTRHARLPDLNAQPLGHYLRTNRYGEAFSCGHLLPMAAAIWSTSSNRCWIIRPRPSCGSATTMR